MKSSFGQRGARVCTGCPLSFGDDGHVATDGEKLGAGRRMGAIITISVICAVQGELFVRNSWLLCHALRQFRLLWLQLKSGVT